MNLSTPSNCPFKLKSAWLTSHITRQSELLAFITNFTSTRERAILERGTISGSQDQEFIFVKTLAHSDGTVTFRGWVDNFPLDVVPWTRCSNIMYITLFWASTGRSIHSWGITEASRLGVKHDNFGWVDLLLSCFFSLAIVCRTITWSAIIIKSNRDVFLIIRDRHLRLKDSWSSTSSRFYSSLLWWSVSRISAWLIITTRSWRILRTTFCGGWCNSSWGSFTCTSSLSGASILSCSCSRSSSWGATLSSCSISIPTNINILTTSGSRYSLFLLKRS